jgi:hypothetical protein
MRTHALEKKTVPGTVESVSRTAEKSYPCALRSQVSKIAFEKTDVDLRPPKPNGIC